MDKFLTNLRIQNFKSLKDVELQPRRVNLLIGKPNAGKSNLLEAISLLGGVAYGTGLADFMRFENVRNVFYDNAVTERRVLVESNLGGAMLRYESDGNMLAYLSAEALKQQSQYLVEQNEAPWPDTRQSYLDGFKNSLVTQLDAHGKFTQQFKGIVSQLPVKKYVFREEKQNRYKAYNAEFLWPPYGENLVDVLQRFRPLRRQVASFFTANGLQLLFRTSENKLEIQKVIDEASYTYPYSSVADTLQRLIFYLAAIESNTDSVLLFEEPEAHTFPEYTTLLGDRIARDQANQYFIATHSLYLASEIMETMLRDQAATSELAIYLTYYEDYQTKLYQLSDQEVREIRRDGIDVFYNLSHYTPGPNPYAA